MAFQPAVISASNGLMAAPAAGAPNATPSTGDAGLFQSLLAGAVDAPVAAGTPTVAPQTALSGGALALLLQTQDAQPGQAAPATTTPAASAPAPADAATKLATPQTTGALPAPAPHNVSAQPAVPLAAGPIAAPLAPAPLAAPLAAAPLVDGQALTSAAEQAVATEPQPVATATPAATPDAAQAIVFAPLAAAQTPAAPTAASPEDAASTPVEADASPQAGLFKKTSFGAPAKAEPSNGAVAKIAGDALATPQTQAAARVDSAQPGAGSPITGFDAPRPAAESISTPVARAVQGAAAMQVAQHVARRFDGQSTNFEVRLDPAELGRVDVKITVDHDKRVTAAVSAESAQTLSDLRGAARDIERALNEAGLDLAQGGLSFNLNQRQASDDQFDAASYSDAAADDSASAETVTIAARPFGMERWSASGVDVWV